MKKLLIYLLTNLIFLNENFKVINIKELISNIINIVENNIIKRDLCTKNKIVLEYLK